MPYRSFSHLTCFNMSFKIDVNKINQIVKKIPFMCILLTRINFYFFTTFHSQTTNSQIADNLNGMRWSTDVNSRKRGIQRKLRERCQFLQDELLVGFSSKCGNRWQTFANRYPAPYINSLSQNYFPKLIEFLMG